MSYRLVTVLGLFAAVSSGCSAGDTPDSSTEAKGKGPGGKTDSIAESCPSQVGINSGTGSKRRCYDTATGQFAPTACCADLCEGAGWREQENGTACAWLDTPGLPDAKVGQFAPGMCCELNDQLACERATKQGGQCKDPQTGTVVDSACCATTPGSTCHPMLVSSIRECVSNQFGNQEADPERVPINSLDALELCTSEGDLTGPMFDEICSVFPETAFCGADFETFHQGYVAPCATDLRGEFDCAFGMRFRDIELLTNNAVIRTFTLSAADAGTLSPLEQSQVLLAVQQSAYSDVTSVSEAFASVDGGIINVIELFELGNAKPFTVYEFGAGDNSFGAIFEHGTTTLTVRINDGDFYYGDDKNRLGCALPYGQAGRPCTNPEGCAPGLKCEGLVDAHPSGGLGKCIDPTLGQGAAEDGNFCDSPSECPLDQGLYCSGLSQGAPGFCRPAWTLGRFSEYGGFAVPDKGTLSRELYAWGLASVPEDARIRLTLSHTAPKNLLITLVPPGGEDGTLATLFDGKTDAASVTPGYFVLDRNIPHPGDESVNGRWTLKITDKTLGHKGTLYDWELSFSSRYD